MFFQNTVIFHIYSKCYIFSLKNLKINKIFPIFLNSFLNFNKIFLKDFNSFSNLLKHFLKFSEKIYNFII